MNLQQPDRQCSKSCVHNFSSQKNPRVVYILLLSHVDMLKIEMMN